jgi:hypothetical protein
MGNLSPDPAKTRSRAQVSGIVLGLAAVALLVRGLLDFSTDLDIAHAPNIWPVVLGVVFAGLSARMLWIGFGPARPGSRPGGPQASGICGSCGLVNDATAATCAGCGASLRVSG